MRCGTENAAGRQCGNFAIVGSDPPRCYIHHRLGDPVWDDLRRRSRGKGRRNGGSIVAVREVDKALETVGWPPALRGLIRRSLVRGLVGEEVEAGR